MAACGFIRPSSPSSFSKRVDVHTAIYDFSKEPMKKLGEKALSFCQKETNLSAVLLFMTQRYYDFEPFLTALDKLGRDIPICGGYAYTYRNEDGIYVFTKDAILSRGILLVTFSGDVKVMTTSVIGLAAPRTYHDHHSDRRPARHPLSRSQARGLFLSEISSQHGFRKKRAALPSRRKQASGPALRSPARASKRRCASDKCFQPRRRSGADGLRRPRSGHFLQPRKHLAISSALPPKGCSSSPVSRGVTT